MGTCAARVSPFFSTGLSAVFLLGATVMASGARADAVSAVQVLREGGCGGYVPRTRPLFHSASLDRTAQDWAAGYTLATAAARNGYPQIPTGVRVTASDASMLEVLRRSQCRAVTDPALREIGMFRRGEETWVVLAPEAGRAPAQAFAPAQPFTPPPPFTLPKTYTPPQWQPRPQDLGRPAQPDSSAALLASRALELVNAARAHATRCGRKMLAAAPPVRLSGTLGGVAFGHAADMAEHNYFEHTDLAGQTPADRVRAVGYREKLVGENIAYGPSSVDEAVQGWLDSPDHCENIMDPRFAEMGIAYAPGRSTRHGLYWVQVLAEPRA